MNGLTTLLFVNGTLMRGLALHANLAGADLDDEGRPPPGNRRYSIGRRPPPLVEGWAGAVAGGGEI